MYCNVSTSIVPDFSALAMPWRKMVMNHSSEYWYMGSMLERSETQKNKICVLTATGMYWLRVTSMSLSVCSAICTFDCHIDNTSNNSVVLRRVKFYRHLLHSCGVFLFFILMFFLDNFKSDCILQTLFLSKSDAVNSVWLAFENYVTV